jgi:large conductance mechanosensitive channel
VIDLAIAVTIGGASGALIAALVDDIIRPIIGVLLGDVDFTSLSVQVGNAMINYGNFVQAIVIFVLIAFVLFLIARSYNRLQVTEKQPVAPPEPSTHGKLLTEIRDLFEAQPY